MNNKKAKQGRIIIPGGRKPWPHELRIANFLAMAGHNIEFLSESNTSTADILLDGIEFLTKKVKGQKRIGELILITKHGQIIDIKSLV